MRQASPAASYFSRNSLVYRPGILHLLARIPLGLMFVFGAYTKLRFNGAWHFRDYHFFFAMAIGTYRTLPLWAVEWFARVLPWVELVLGALLIAGVGKRWVWLVSSALLLFMASMPRAAFLGLASRMNPATELLVDTGLFLVAITIALSAFQLHRARQPQP
jgi:uncharacterized membrane protein YphA (DoxX/SURF4 family)